MKEIWKTINGFEGKYEVSNLGNIKSLPRTIVRKNGTELPIKGKKLKQRMNNKGYYRVSLEGKSYFVHRLVAKEFLLKPNGYNVVNHIDCNPKNNEVSNLEWCTQKQNMEHAKKCGRLKYGEERNNKIRDALKKYAKPIVSIKITTGEKKHYSSIQEAAKVYGSAGNICDCCKNSGHSYKGCKFYYEF